jgi:RHS repeat-associated protein
MIDCLPMLNRAASNPTSQFTGKERDAETGLDFFLARYYSAAQGRFMTPDWAAKPEPVPYAKLNNPQTLNLYAYVQNNPLTIADRDGHGDYYKNGKKERSDKIDDGIVYVSYDVKEKIEGKIVTTTKNLTFSRDVGVAIRDTADRTTKSIPLSAKNKNLHEEGFTRDSTGIHQGPTGPSYQPGDTKMKYNQNVASDADIIAHAHPAGNRNDSNNSWAGIFPDQEPSKVDKADAAAHPNAINMVIGVGNSTVYIYDANGTLTNLPLGAFPTK